MREVPYMGEILGPEFYFEDELYDSRIAIKKLNDVYHTFYEANTSIVYANSDEYDEENIETKLIRKSHLRHAVIDLNNCFDLLLQVPWFYYRIGLNENEGIKRNSNDWVARISAKCRYKYVVKPLKSSSDNAQKKIGESFEKFSKEFLFNASKPFTIRSLVNDLKHNGSMPIAEFEEPMVFNLPMEGVDTSQMRKELEVAFFDEDTPEIQRGKIKVVGEKFALIDIEYNSGELFRGKDYSYYNKSFSLKEIYDESILFHDEFINVLEVIYENIFSKIPHSPICKNPTINKGSKSIDLNKWYKK